MADLALIVTSAMSGTHLLNLKLVLQRQAIHGIPVVHYTHIYIYIDLIMTYFRYCVTVHLVVSSLTVVGLTEQIHLWD